MPNPMQLTQMMQQLKSNPAQFLGTMDGVNMQDPNAIIQNLMNNGKVTQQQYNQAVNIARQMGFIK